MGILRQAKLNIIWSTIVVQSGRFGQEMKRNVKDT